MAGNNKTFKPIEEARIMTLPIDIMMMIFLKLQIKPLFCCKSVCKLWRNTINTCYFDDLHRSMRTMSASRESQLVLISYSEGVRELYGVNPEKSTNTFTVSQLPPIPIQEPELSPIIHVINVGDGFNLIVGKGHNSMLYNPIRGEKFILPPSSISKEELDLSSSAYGLGFDNSTKQYKLVRIVELFSKQNIMLSRDVTEVYTLGSNKWRQLSGGSLYPAESLRKGIGTLAYGDVHWRVDRDNVIVSFEIKKENFKVARLPDAITSYGSLFNWREELTILQSSCRTTMSDITIWVVRDYDNMIWEKMYTLDFPPFDRCSVTTWGDGFVFDISNLGVNDEMMINDADAKLLHWDPKKGDLTVTANSAISELLETRPYDMFETYTDNLISLVSYTNSASNGFALNHAQPN